MSNCRKCATEFEGKPQDKTGFCSGCVEAIKREKKQTASTNKATPKKNK